MNTPPRYDREDYTEVIRAMIKHENELLNSRLGWFFTLQGLLLATLGISLKQESNSDRLISMISAFGVVSSFSVCMLTFATRNTIDRLFTWWEDNRPLGYEGPSVMGGYSPRWKRRLHVPNVLMPWFLIPILFVLLWFGVIFFVKPLPKSIAPKAEQGAAANS